MTTTPSGLTEDGLENLHRVMALHIEEGRLPGAITLVAKDDAAAVDVSGTKAFGDSEPLRRDDLFRIASLNKPITGLATMILVEDGTLGLGQSIEDLLPELSGRRVLTSIEASLSDTVDATRPITVEDLLTFRLGFGAVMAPPGTYPIQVAEAELELGTLGPPWPPHSLTTDEWLSRLGSLPLMSQPGEQWLYNTGAQILGALIERATGRSQEEFFRKRIFEPLGMSDTGYTVSPEKIGRLTTAYFSDPESGAPEILDSPENSYWSEPLPFPTAAGWLVSTIDDYWEFVKLFLNRGRGEDGERIISERSLDLMTSDHLTRKQRLSAHMVLGGHSGWGLCVAVPATGVETESVPGGFGWNGGTGTAWRTDPDNGLTSILFTQRAMSSPEPPPIFLDFWEAAYSSLES